MTAPWPRPHPILCALLLACADDEADDGGDPDDGGPTDADTDTDADSDSDTDTDTDTDTGSTHAFAPATVLVAAWFGYDAETGGMVDVVTPYGTIESRIRLEVGSTDWEATGFDGERTDLYCVIELPLTDSSFAAWAQADPGIWFGVAYTGATPDTDCSADEGYDIDPAAYAGFPDLATALASAHPWGIGVGEIGADNLALLGYVAGYPYQVLPPGSIVGGYALDGVRNGVSEQLFAVAHPIDDRGLVDHTAYLDAGDVHAGGELASGYYRFYFLYVDRL